MIFLLLYGFKVILPKVKRLHSIELLFSFIQKNVNPCFEFTFFYSAAYANVLLVMRQARNGKVKDKVNQGNQI